MSNSLHVRRGHLAINQEIRRGRLLPVQRQACSGCGRPAQEYHHYNGYGRAYLAKVIPVCKSCHKIADMLRRYEYYGVDIFNVNFDHPFWQAVEVSRIKDKLLDTIRKERKIMK